MTTSNIASVGIPYMILDLISGKILVKNTTKKKIAQRTTSTIVYFLFLRYIRFNPSIVFVSILNSLSVIFTYPLGILNSDFVICMLSPLCIVIKCFELV